MNHCLSRILRPDRLSLIGIKRHRQYRRILGAGLLVNHRVPDKLGGTCPSEISNILSLVDPRFFPGGLRLFICQSFLWRHDKLRLKTINSLEPVALLGGQHRLWISKNAGCRYDVIVWNRERHLVVAELKGEFTPS